jgi:hypothetical protein
MKGLLPPDMRFLRALKAVAGNLMRNRMFQALVQIARLRPLTCGLLALCVAGLAILGWIIHGYFRVEDRKIFINLVGGPISRADFRIEKGRVLDDVRLDFNLNSADLSSENRTGAILVPENFTKRDSYCHDAEIHSPVNIKPGLSYNFEITGNSPSCTITFQAKVLTTVARELDLDFSIGTMPPAKFPVGLVFANMEKLDVSALEPAPTLHNPYTIQYEPLPPNSLEITGISMQLRDRERSAREDFTIFAVGILTGVVCSLIAGILYEFVQRLEQRLASEH